MRSVACLHGVCTGRKESLGPGGGYGALRGVATGVYGACTGEWCEIAVDGSIVPPDGSGNDGS